MSEREGYRERGEVKKVSVLLMYACVSFQNLALMVIVYTIRELGAIWTGNMHITSCKEHCFNFKSIKSCIVSTA